MYKLALLNKCFKRGLSHFSVHSSAKDSLRSAKNVIFLLLCILINKPMGDIIAPLPGRPGYATVSALATHLNTTIQHMSIHGRRIVQN